MIAFSLGLPRAAACTIGGVIGCFPLPAEITFPEDLEGVFLHVSFFTYWVRYQHS